VVAPFPVGPSNVENLEHLLPWTSRRPILLIDHAPGERWDYADGRAEAARARLLAGGAIRTADGASALDWIRDRSAATAPAPSAARE